MRETIFRLLRERYSSFGLGDEMLMAHAEWMANNLMIDATNVENIIFMQESYLAALQRMFDKRINDLREKVKKEVNLSVREKEIKATLVSNVFNTLVNANGIGKLKMTTKRVIETANELYNGIL